MMAENDDAGSGGLAVMGAYLLGVLTGALLGLFAHHIPWVSDRLWRLELWLGLYRAC